MDWSVKGSRQSHDCVNPIRLCEELYFTDAKAQRDQTKSLIKLSIGDPSVFGNLPPPPAAYEGLRLAMEDMKLNGYAHSSGLHVAREAVANMMQSTSPIELTAENVVMSHSGSGAILMSIEVLCDVGTSLLVPTPGFSLYKCHADALGIKAKFYKLLPERSWEVDLEDLERQVDDSVRAIVVNNPSNPCGSVYSKTHLQDILKIAERHRLPIISDDIYHEMVFAGQDYTPLSLLSRNVPILSCGGISKRFMVPGWRMGWIVSHDRNDAFKKEIIPGLSRLAMKLLGPCTLIQACLPYLFEHTPSSYHIANMAIVEKNAKLVYDGLMKAPGLTPIMPAGSMYMMVTIDMEKFPKFDTDVEFTKQLLIQESVFCLPGYAFSSSRCFRVVLMMPDDMISVALLRMQQFCAHHYTDT